MSLTYSIPFFHTLCLLYRWKALFNVEFSACVVSEETSDKSWRCRYEERKRTERNWNRGEPQRITLIGHRGTVTSLATAKRHIISGSDDGSLIFWGLARRSLQPSIETTPPPALALAQLAQHRRTSTSVFSSNFERSLNAFGNMNITGSSHTQTASSSSSTSSSSSSGSSSSSNFGLSHSSPDSASSMQVRKTPSSSNTPNILNMFSSNNSNTKYGNSAGAELGALPRPAGAIDDVKSPLTHYGQFEKLRYYHGHGG